MNPYLLKCKAQQIQSCEWLYGYVVSVIYNNEIHYFIVSMANMSLNIDIRCEINPKTICKFTGTYDSNNDEIYDGDIIDTERGRFEVYYDDLTMSYVVGDNNKFLYEFNSIYVIGNAHDDVDFFNEIEE